MERADNELFLKYKELLKRDYQADLICKIVDKKKVGLFTPCGGGKTVIVLSAIKELVDRGEIGKVLVLAPPRVIRQNVWGDEKEAFKHLSYLNLLSFDPKLQLKDRKELYYSALSVKAHIHVFSMDNIGWLELYGDLSQYDMLVIDESSKFRNPSTDRFLKIVKYAKKVKGCVLMSGTPTPNCISELWAQVFILDGGQRLGVKKSSFMVNYFFRDEYSRKNHLRFKAKNKILDKVKDICFTVNIEDNIDLPKSIDRKIKIGLSEQALTKHNIMRDELFVMFENGETVTASNAGVKLGKMRQIANGFLYTEDGEAIMVHNEKIKALSELIDTELEGENVIVLYQYKEDLKMLLKAFPEAKIPISKKDFDDWNEGKIKMLLLQPKSASHGLNLQFGGHNIIWYGMSFSYEEYEQANKRLVRSGQKNKIVNIYHFISEGTIDEFMYGVVRGKESNQKGILEHLKEWKDKILN